MFRSAKLLKAFYSGLKAKPKIVAPCIVQARNGGSITTWNKDWKPGPYPKTEEARIAAAKKYNMLPEDYQPYPEEEGFGDYPMFHNYHMESRDPFEAYDYPSLKRNFGETVHPDYDIALEEKVNFQQEFKTPLWKQFLFVITAVSLYTAIILYDQSHLPNQRKAPKAYPYTGAVHYTFEPAE